jgi:hypothetical protein
VYVAAAAADIRASYISYYKTRGHEKAILKCGFISTLVHTSTTMRRIVVVGGEYKVKVSMAREETMGWFSKLASMATTGRNTVPKLSCALNCNECVAFSSIAMHIYNIYNIYN